MPSYRIGFADCGFKPPENDMVQSNGAEFSGKDAVQAQPWRRDAAWLCSAGYQCAGGMGI